jgi:hypothetical protein
MMGEKSVPVPKSLSVESKLDIAENPMTERSHEYREKNREKNQG